MAPRCGPLGLGPALPVLVAAAARGVAFRPVAGARTRLPRAAALLCAAAVGCRAADVAYVDSPVGAVFAAVDTLRVGAAVEVNALACAPGQSLCVARVRDLRWRASDPAVLRLEAPPHAGQGVLARGLRAGRAYVVGYNAAGADSVALTVRPSPVR